MLIKETLRNENQELNVPINKADSLMFKKTRVRLFVSISVYRMFLLSPTYVLQMPPVLETYVKVVPNPVSGEA